MLSGVAVFSLSSSSTLIVGISGLLLTLSSSSSGSAIGDPAPLFLDSCIPVHIESRADLCLYTTTETEIISIPSPSSTMADLSRLDVYKDSH